MFTIAGLNKDRDRLKDEIHLRDKYIRRLEDEISALKIERNDLQFEVSSLEGKVECLNMEVHDLELEIRSLEDTIDYLEDKVYELEEEL